MIIARLTEKSGRFRTTFLSWLRNREQGPETSKVVDAVKLSLGRSHAAPYSPLRGMSEVSHSLSAGLQSLSQWLLPFADSRGQLGRMYPVLLLRQTSGLYTGEIQRDEDLYGREGGTLSRLWDIAGNFCDEWKSTLS